MPNYPTSLDTSSSLPNPTAGSATNSPSHSSLHSQENAAIIAVEGKVGIGASVPANNTLLIGTGAGTSSWSALTSAQLIAILSDETGSGSAVFANTPTLITPKVDTIQENTPANGVTVAGVNLKSGVITTASAVGTAALANASVTPGKLATGAVQAFVATDESTASTSYTDLATVTDTVTATIGANGLALVSLYVGQMRNDGAARANASFAMSGANTLAASDNYQLMCLGNAANIPQIGSGAVFLMTGLNTGSTTFKMKYKASATNAWFQARRITVVPL